MGKKYRETRKWTPSKVETAFEEKMSENGFSVLGYKECNTFTDYLISKDGTDIEFRIYHNKCPSASLFADTCYQSMVRAYDIKKTYEAVLYDALERWSEDRDSRGDEE